MTIRLSWLRRTPSTYKLYKVISKARGPSYYFTYKHPKKCWEFPLGVFYEQTWWFHLLWSFHDNINGYSHYVLYVVVLSLLAHSSVITIPCCGHLPLPQAWASHSWTSLARAWLWTHISSPMPLLYQLFNSIPKISAVLHTMFKAVMVLVPQGPIWVGPRVEGFQLQKPNRLCRVHHLIYFAQGCHDWGVFCKPRYSKHPTFSPCSLFISRTKLLLINAKSAANFCLHLHCFFYVDIIFRPLLELINWLMQVA